MPEFDCSKPIAAVVRLGSGLVDVLAEDRSTALVEITPFDDTDAGREAARSVSVDFRDDQLVVSGPERAASWLWRRSQRLRVQVRVPLDSHLVAKVGSADVLARGRYRLAEINMASGDAYVDHVAGDVHVNTASGDLTVERIDGALQAKTASGDISVRRVDGDVSVHAASGDLEIGQARGSVRANTASGDIEVGVASQGDVRLRAASGDVTVGVLAGTGVWLDLSTTSGDVRNDLPMALTPSAGEPAASLRLQVHTISGDIRVGRVPVNLTTAA
jgi:DUF4097 and DUF4098 domain-containing protein YvlB